MTLDQLVVRAAERHPEAVAVRGPDVTLSYGELDQEADRVAHLLRALGVERGDRVGIWLEKSATAVVAMQAVLRLGAAYVPLDPLSPLARIALMAEDCRMKAVVIPRARQAALSERLPELRTLGATPGGGERFEGIAQAPGTPVRPEVQDEQALAYILYTSGSTGRPKGVCLSHRNALAFVEWAASELDARPEDRFANHAPFFFDLSVLDLYAAFWAGASCSIIPEGAAYVPQRLVEQLTAHAITVWYSVPSALILMMERGGLLEEEVPSLRAVLFAGEPFPLKPLRRLRARWPEKRFLNLYGPTETNVCTFHEVGQVPGDGEPLPIGRPCCGDRAWLQDPSPRSEADPTPVGILMVEGPTVMLGYWGQPPQVGPYPTGDLVSQREDGAFLYHGRADSMVKVRGRRVELGEIEAVLATHPEVSEGCVLLRGSGMESRLVAVVASPGSTPPGLLSVKRHLASQLPPYMLVDEVQVLPALPRTRNGKVDRLALTRSLEKSTAP